jgi:hypothetical protein
LLEVVIIKFHFFFQGGSKMKYDYGKAMSLSILFYDAQRSGRLPDNNPIKWRGNSAMQDLVPIYVTASLNNLQELTIVPTPCQVMTAS